MIPCHSPHSRGVCQSTAPCVDKCPHEIPGFDWQGREIATAGNQVYRFGDWFRDDLAKLSAEDSGNPVRLVCRKTGIAFAGFVPHTSTDRHECELCGAKIESGTLCAECQRYEDEADESNRDADNSGASK